MISLTNAEMIPYFIYGLLEYLTANQNNDPILHKILVAHSALFKQLINYLVAPEIETAENSAQILKVGLKIINIFCGGQDESDEALINLGLIELAKKLIWHKNEEIVLCIVCILKNICACKPEISQILFLEQNRELLECLQQKIK